MRTTMTPKEYRAALEKLGVSNYAFAPLIGIHLNTAQNYAAGKTRIPGPVALLLRLMIAHGITPADLAA